jgi:hypothetical protein
MSKIAFIAALTSILSFPAFAEDHTLDGTYKLVSSTRKLLDTGEVIEAYGKHPNGYVNYGKDGRFLVLIVSDKNDRPNPENVKVITDQQRADLFRTMTSYGGTYTFDGHTLEHHVDISWNQVWTGTTVIRDVQRDGDKLIYTTRPAPSTVDGKMSVLTLVWQKAD